MRKFFMFVLILGLTAACRSNETATEATESADTIASVSYKEPHRPQFHFSPPEKWMNDPNGMVFHNGEYHLFYQYHPNGLTWGPMHWGHAISKDLMHWEHLPVALYPDKNGMIFSGSAVLDKNNTSGLGSAENPPLVAIFTFHNMEREKAGHSDYQSQGIAYSTDAGRTWKMFEGNPVLPNQGVKDFRDPKVFWHDETAKWIMILAVSDHTELWASDNLKQWSKLSEFGREYGAHGGVWECPDLFELPANGNSRKWVMLVSINPGGPNGGSATQYFTGDFDGKTFTPDNAREVKLWLDYGPDNYAGVTWANASDNRKIFLGWMSNWAYAEAVPTSPWRSATTLPRDLSLVSTPQGLRVGSILSEEISAIAEKGIRKENVTVSDPYALNGEGVNDLSQSLITGTVEVKDFSIELSNSKGQKLAIGFDAGKNQYFIDRGEAGNRGFSEGFVPRIVAPRISPAGKINFTIALDVSSVEVFFDDGLSVMTSLFFPDEVLSTGSISAPASTQIDVLEVKPLRSVWH